MPNVLPIDDQTFVTALLAEGLSIRAIERLSEVLRPGKRPIHRDTIMRLGAKVGDACADLLDKTMRGLECKYLQVDEIWGFVGKKHRNTNANDPTGKVGSIWAHVAMDKETKIVPAFKVGPRDSSTSNAFLNDLASRVKNRVQLSTDGMNSYLTNVEDAFGNEIDYGMVVKKFSVEYDEHEHRKYSPPTIVEIKKTVVSGDPDWDEISTSHIEVQNLTMRMHVRRLTRLTNAFSKKFENHRAAIGLYFAYYNFCLTHSSLRMTPAMAAGLAQTTWNAADLVALIN